jgi:hypothetical protein
MRDCSGIDRVNRNALIEIRTARFPKVSLRERLADVNLKSVALKVAHDHVRVFYGDNNVVSIDVDLPRITCD